MQSSASRETCHGAAVHPTMPHYRFADLAAVALLACLGGPCAAQVSPADTGAPQVQVSRAPGQMDPGGQENVVVLNEADLAVTVEAGPAVWKMVPSSSKDLLVSKDGDEFNLRLADAKEIRVTPYETGFKTGDRARPIPQHRSKGARRAAGRAGGPDDVPGGRRRRAGLRSHGQRARRRGGNCTGRPHWTAARWITPSSPATTARCCRATGPNPIIPSSARPATTASSRAT